MRNENVFRIKVINFEKLYFQFCKHNYRCGVGVPSVTLSELVSSQNSTVEDANLFEENGLFYQIEFVRGVVPSNNKQKPNIINEIIFLDFKATKKDFLKNYYDDIKYLFEKGFRVYNNERLEKIEYEFVPFEKSASMGKDFKISFISKLGYDDNKNPIEDFYQKVLERSYLGLNEKVVDGVPLAKRYAYRGLLLSTGKRVSIIDIRVAGILKKFKFSKQTVLLVQDMNELGTQGVPYFTQEAEKWNDNHSALIFKSKTIKKNTDENFEKCMNDGYGFIGNELADSIDKVLSKDGADNKHSSYQIRLPFVKGMVHRVNYQDFFSNVANEEGIVTLKSYDQNLNECDISYKLDELKDVQLIISESMFKVIKELRAFKKNHPEIDDLMDYYFTQLNNYWHSLFILNMDKANGKQESETSWNYQYISTVELSDKEFDELFEYSSNIYKGIKTDLIERINYICSKDSIEEDDEEEIAEDIVENGNIDDKGLSLETRLLSLKIKNDMIKEPYFKNLLKKELDKMAENFGKGRILLKGQDRFILGDPLRYLYWLTDTKIDNSELLPDNSFYMPGVMENGDIKEGNLYPVLRNPHLSRNEDLLLSIHFPKQNSQRYKYLSNLTGTVIIDSTHSSIPAETLQGCDFDGDHAKIYFNNKYAEAILKNRKNGNSDGYPIVINDEYKKFDDDQSSNNKDRFTDNWQNRFKVTMNTFSSSIGLISNLAFKESLSAYRTDCIKDETIEDSKDKLRVYAILTGVEADSPKTGIKPDFRTIDGNNSKNADTEIFINFKSFLNKKKTKSEVKSEFIRDNKDETDIESKYKSIYEEKDEEKFVKSFNSFVGRKPSNVETLIQKYNDLTNTKSIPIKRNENMLSWALPKAVDVDDDSGKIYKGGKYNSVLSIVNAYNRIVNEKNYKLHTSNTKGSYYAELLTKAKWFNNTDGEKILNNLISILTEKVDYNDFYSLYSHCTRERLVYKYYPYFSNPLDDYEKSIELAKQYLKKLFNRFHINSSSNVLDEDNYDLILSDAKFLYQLLNNVRDRRYATYENSITIENFDDIKKLLIDEKIIDCSLSSDDSNIRVNCYIDELRKTIHNCKKDINDVIRKILDTKNNQYLDVDNNIVYDKYLMILIRGIYNCESLNINLAEIMKKNSEKFLHDIMKKISSRETPVYQKDSIIKEIINVLDNYLVSSIIKEKYKISVSNELIKISNTYRLAEASMIDKTQIAYYNEFMAAIKDSNSYWKCILNKKTISKLKEVLNPNLKHTEEEVEEEMVKYVRACEEEADSKQGFLMNVIGEIYYKVLVRKEGIQ